MSEEFRRRLELEAIVRDAQFGRRFTEGMARNEDVAVIAVFGLFSSLALMVYESHRYLQKHHPVAADEIKLGHADLIARSRHSLKFFDQPKKSLRDLVSYFDREILQTQIEEFTGNARFAWAQRFETDLGLYFCRGTLVTTTHAAALALGLSATDFRSNERVTVLEGVGFDLGSYFGSLSIPQESPTTTFLDFVERSDMSSKDVMSWRYYVEGKGAVDRHAMALGGLLKSFGAALGFLQAMLSLDTLEDSRPTVFKIKYVTTYQIVSSLRILAADQTVSLTASQRALCDGIRDSALPSVLSSKGSRLLRNTLVHYEMMNNVDVAQLDASLPLHGLVEHYLGVPTLEAAQQLLDEEIEELLALFRQ